jgi:chemotaxis signal transduction protein
MRARRDPLSVLRDRAVRLAQPTVDDDAGPSIELLEGEVAGRRFGFECSRIRSVLPNPGLCRLPAECGGLLGLVPTRGTVVPVCDLAALLDAGPTVHDRPFVVLIDDEAPVGVLVDTVDAVRHIRTSDIRHVMPSSSDRGLAAGVTDDDVVVVDVERLLADPRLEPAHVPDPASVRVER